MGNSESLSARWQKAEVLGTVAGGLLIPVVILLAGHSFTTQQAKAADARQNSDRIAQLLSHLASANPQERILAIQALRYHRETHDIPDEIVAPLVTVAATDDSTVASAALTVLGTSLKPEIERQRLLLELLGPMVLELDKTRGAFDVWTANNTALVTEVIREGNTAVQSLLLKKAHLIPHDLVNDAVTLLGHYKQWFIEYERVRRDKDTAFVFVGPKGYPFPTDAEQKFRKRYEELIGSSGAAPVVPARSRSDNR